MENATGTTREGSDRDEVEDLRARREAILADLAAERALELLEVAADHGAEQHLLHRRDLPRAGSRRSVW